ncbi:uncharacterized protein LOC123305867 [Chrysoperla carnea]|uniref:uncharacterized protein LOC123305867 n=1 Tax=Chrysoperla carnea TaxID=189513 RepID=UPI001D07F75E|nr:uncharacterized protein LOC123305867 [Chrysoperla carnea]
MALLTTGKYPELLTTLILLIYPNFQVCQSNNDKIVFSFPEFPYKDTSKNEMKFHEFESACEQAATCRQLNGVAKIRCIRECVSPSCYRDIYQSDQLEEGEIDVRLNSFKGCFVQRSSRPRN